MNPQTACMATQNHLGFQPGLFWDMSLPIDCKDLVYSAHTLKHSITGSDFLDLAWLIPDNPMSTESITPTLIAVATVAMEETLVKWLQKKLKGLVTNGEELVYPFHSIIPQEDCLLTLQELEAGTV